MARKQKRSTTTEDGVPGRRRQWAADRALRPAMRSPGRPEPSRAVQRAFWRLIAQGLTSEAGPDPDEAGGHPAMDPLTATACCDRRFGVRSQRVSMSADQLPAQVRSLLHK